jgi:hypothetical protein
MGRKNSVFSSHPAQGYHVVYLFHIPGASLWAFSAGSATPHFFTFNLSHPERSFPDELAHAKGPYPVPGANSIAFSALIAEFDGGPALRFYFIY